MTTSKILTHNEVLAVLSEQAKAGSVTAAAALERALRARGREEDDQLDQELRDLLNQK